jgi:hypothetical protein
VLGDVEVDVFEIVGARAANSEEIHVGFIQDNLRLSLFGKVKANRVMNGTLPPARICVYIF